MAGKGKLTVFDPGEIAAARRNTSYTVRNADTGWFPPGQPIQPVAQEAKGRAFDYRVGRNLVVQPKYDEGITFWQLRGIAENCDIIRLAIETRKDQIEKKRWNISPKDEDKEPDDRCLAIEKFLQFPDRRLPWKTWLRALVDDLLVIDAPTIYPRKTNGGQLYALELIDGATISRKVGLDGRTPLAPDVAYQQILHGVPAVDYSTSDLIYMPRNVRTYKLYGYSPVEQILVTANTQIRRALYQLKYYTSGTIPEGFLEAPATWQTEQIEEFQLYLDDMMSGDLDRRNQAFVVPNGMKFTEAKQPQLTDAMDEYLARLVCFAFSIPPTPFVKQMNRATSETAKDSALEEGLEPLCDWVKQVIDFVILNYFGYDDLEFQWNQEDSTDPLVQAQIDSIYLAQKPAKTQNEVRATLGLKPIKGGDVLNAPAANTKPDGSPIENDDDKVSNEENDSAEEKLAKLNRKKKARETPPNNSHQTLIVSHAVKRTTSLVTKFLKEQGEKFAEAAAEQFEQVREKVAKDDSTNDASDQSDRIVETLNFSDWESLPPKVSEILQGVAAEGAEIALGTLGIETQKMRLLVNEDAVAYADQRAAEMVGMKWVDGELVANPAAKWTITNTTRKALQATIETAIEEGYSVAQLKDAIVEDYAFSPDRAETIARTEMATAHVAGNMIAYRASGVVVGKKWLLALNPCPICEANAEVGIIPLDEEFPSGDDAPPVHPNCECDVAPITDPSRIGEKDDD